MSEILDIEKKTVGIMMKVIGEIVIILSIGYSIN